MIDRTSTAYLIGMACGFMISCGLPLFGFAVGCWRWGKPMLRQKRTLFVLGAYYTLAALAVVAMIVRVKLCFLPPLLLGTGIALGLKLALVPPVSKHRFPHGHCQQCGHNLTGNLSGACPECGTKINSAEPRAP